MSGNVHNKVHFYTDVIVNSYMLEKDTAWHNQARTVYLCPKVLDTVPGGRPLEPFKEHPVKPDQAATKNILLTLLSPQAFSYLAPFMRLLDHPRDMVLVEKKNNFRYAYFPEEGLISSVVETQRGSPIEVGTVGREGFVGIPMVLGTRLSETKLFSQLAGSGWEVDAGDFESVLENNSEIRQLCNRFIMTAIFQATQTIACNRTHSLEQRCARWLLMSTDREQIRSVSLTRAYLAMMVGYEEGVSVTLDGLRERDIVRYEIDSVVIKNREKLETITCECYSEVKANFECAIRAKNSS